MAEARNDARAVMEKVLDLIDETARFLPAIAEVPAAEFERGFVDRIRAIEELSAGVPEHRSELMAYAFHRWADELDVSEIQRQSRHKPLGYAGDFRVIDWIYTRRTAPGGRARLWDEFYHRQAAPGAVRNRKVFLRHLFTGLAKERSGGLSVLNLASGPCRDVYEAVTAAGDGGLASRFLCVDADPRAVEYARAIAPDGLVCRVFEWKVANVFRLRTARRFDLVWCAGLFDYLEDRLAVALLRRMWRWTAPGGQMVVGAFHPRNPSKAWMEWGGAWFLIHRSEADMAALSERAGIPADALRFEAEPLGVCLFTTVSRG